MPVSVCYVAEQHVCHQYPILTCSCLPGMRSALQPPLTLTLTNFPWGLLFLTDSRKWMYSMANIKLLAMESACFQWQGDKGSGSERELVLHLPHQATPSQPQNLLVVVLYDGCRGGEGAQLRTRVPVWTLWSRCYSACSTPNLCTCFHRHLSCSLRIIYIAQTSMIVTGHRRNYGQGCN